MAPGITVHAPKKNMIMAAAQVVVSSAPHALLLLDLQGSQSRLPEASGSLVAKALQGASHVVILTDQGQCLLSSITFHVLSNPPLRRGWQPFCQRLRSLLMTAISPQVLLPAEECVQLSSLFVELVTDCFKSTMPHGAQHRAK